MSLNEWEQVRLGDVINLLTGHPFKSERYDSEPTSPRLLRGDNVAQGYLRWDGAQRWHNNATEGLENYWLQKDDVILAMDRPWIEAGLKYASVRDPDLPSLLVQRVARLRGTSNLDTKFLKYIIGSQDFTDYILAVQTGTAVPHISSNQIKDFEFSLPPLPTQHAIARILSSLDDKIELNRQMNETLEAMARAIFQSWFVDFDPVRAKAEGRDTGLPPEVAVLFPDGFVEVDGREVPRGWGIEPLDKIAIFLNGLALQKYPAESDDIFLPVIKIAQMHKGDTVGSDKASVEIPQEYIINDGDVLFSWSGSLEVILWCGGRGALNQHLFKVSSVLYPKWFYYYWTLHHLLDFQLIAEGKATTMGHIQRHHLSEAMVIVPPSNQMERMDNVMAPLVNKIVANAIESRTLAQIRDALLPKLMSGEISPGNDLGTKVL